jgi:N utilization substance protein B
MKSATDPRHKRRKTIIKQLFANSYAPQEAHEDTISIMRMKDEINDMITKAAPAWPIEKINRIDLAILQLAVYELKHSEVPPKVAIDEAIELAKQYGGESSPSFINGVLGNIMDQVNATALEKPTEDENI